MDELYMKMALDEAEKAAVIDEVPVGAVIVKDGIVIAKAHNLRESLKDPTAHAEIIAIREACKNLGGWRLTGCTLYVTLEPCPMCAGAIINSRIKRVVFGAPDPKSGALGSVMDLSDVCELNHSFEVDANVLFDECAGILKEFFKGKRK